MATKKSAVKKTAGVETGTETAAVKTAAKKTAAKKVAAKKTVEAVPESQSTGAGAGKKAKAQPTHHDVSVRAYLLWERDGRKHGHHDHYWKQAEQELASE